MKLKPIDIINRPGFVVRRIIAKIYEFTHPNEPWLSPGAIQFCTQQLTKDWVGLEWGSGRSTAWFGQRLKQLLSIEYNREWHSKVVGILKNKNLKNVECRYIALEHDLVEPNKPDYEKMPIYVKVAEQFEDNSLDFVVVDGHYRQACILTVLSKVKPGGLLLVDNTDWLPLNKWGVPEDWHIVHQSSNIMKQITTIWRKP